MQFAETWTDLQTVILTKWEREQICILMFICRIWDTNTDEQICQAEIQTDAENKRVDTKREGGEGRIERLGLTYIHWGGHPYIGVDVDTV